MCSYLCCEPHELRWCEPHPCCLPHDRPCLRLRAVKQDYPDLRSRQFREVPLPLLLPLPGHECPLQDETLTLVSCVSQGLDEVPVASDGGGEDAKVLPLVTTNDGEQGGHLKRGREHLFIYFCLFDFFSWISQGEKLNKFGYKLFLIFLSPIWLRC